jgi:glycosyltransferase involved in cell wall biosynthesis
MRIRSLGFRGISGQIDRIEEGFRSLGHIVNDGDPELIYANDIGHWDEALDIYSQFPNSKCILIILDLPFHLPQACREQIEVAKSVIRDYPEVKICTISNKVASDLRKHCDYSPSVIYQPIKDITNQGIKWSERLIEYLIVGRNTDEQKGHGDVTIPCIKQIHGDISSLYTVGEGLVGAQNYRNVTDEQLNTIYNNSKYVFCPSKFEGFCLPLVEAMAAGCIPISYHWHPTAKEFIPKELIFKSVDDIIEFIQSNKDKPQLFFEQNFIDNFRKEKIAQNIIKIYENKISNRVDS